MLILCHFVDQNSRDIYVGYILKRFVIFSGELEFLYEFADIVKGTSELADQSLDVGFEIGVIFGINLSLEIRVRTKIGCFCHKLDSMSSERHDPIRSNRNPLIPSLMQSIIMHKDVVSVLIDDLSLDPLAGGIFDIDPLSDFQFPPLQFKGADVLHEVEIDAFHELVDGVFALLEDL